MQSTEPVPGDPWPHEMLITIQDDTQTLRDLLWVREAWALAPEGADLPPLLVDTPITEHADADTPLASWTAAWPGLWHACLAHAGTPRDPEVIARLSTPELDQDTRRTLLADLFGPSWQDAFGDDALTTSKAAWDQARFEESTAPDRLRRTPERDCLDALVPAWRAGLTTIVELPCRGAYTHRLGDHGLVVTSGTRADVDAYGAALRSFVPSA